MLQSIQREQEIYINLYELIRSPWWDLNHHANKDHLLTCWKLYFRLILKIYFYNSYHKVFSKYQRLDFWKPRVVFLSQKNLVLIYETCLIDKLISNSKSILCIKIWFLKFCWVSQKSTRKYLIWQCNWLISQL